MREIKFRAWDENSQEMIYEIGITPEGIPYSIPDNAEASDQFNYYPSCHKMQYTGLKDRQGRMIYEKDIAEESYINPMTGKNVVDRYVIEWENGIHKMKYIGNQKGMDRYLWMRLDEIEVIGDVYRNPELLGAAEEC